MLLFDAAGAALGQLGRDHGLSLPGYLHVARPDEPLSALRRRGTRTWTLTLCDTEAGGDTGTYLAGRLLLQAQDSAARNGNWFQNLKLPEMDGVEQTVSVYGLDEAGNRTTEPLQRTFVLDNVAPQIDVTHVISEVRMTPDLAPLGVLTGTVSDGGGGCSGSLPWSAHPCGQLYQQQQGRP